MTRRDLLISTFIREICTMNDRELYDTFSDIFPEKAKELDMCQWCPRDVTGFCLPKCPPPSEFLQETIEIKENHT